MKNYVFVTDSELNAFLKKLGDLSLDADSFEVALAALRLQTLLKTAYGV